MKKSSRESPNTLLSRMAENSVLPYCRRSQPVVSDFTTLNYRVTLLHI
jgi:hypothetical protein